ncbi:uncharacterized protein DNG_10350 [Cephalotrichum gorgonifer]|uniref:Steroid 5-alpha reductase C-terminal domain-containing protein n=1 Tax=Cephalotrichum gorgonifer TaxID=2041049 RepID=A0AAE8N7F5_9PEZI|nr:uncharacterized protein DNG_10350 [Cephalotrichum gorgonifer]
MEVKALDEWNLGLTALITIGYQLFFFSIAYGCQFDLLTDLAGGTNFALLSLITLFFSEDPHPRRILASALLTLWALRLSAFLFYRILKTGHDTRFDGMRHRFFAFLTFWIFQMMWVWAVSLPVTLGNSAAVAAAARRAGGEEAFGTAGDVAGVVMFGVGFLVEVVADGQRYAFRRRHGGGSAAVCEGGLWRFSRHPNYFGDILAQFGIYTISTSSATTLPASASGPLYASIVGPLFITLLLLFLSGLPLSERPVAKRRYELDLGWDAYEAYLRRTSPLFPFPPGLYERVPVWLKRTLFLEFPMYVFEPGRDSKIGKGEGRAKEGGKESGEGGQESGEGGQESGDEGSDQGSGNGAREVTEARAE